MLYAVQIGLGLVVGAFVGWFIASRRAAHWFSAREAELLSLSGQYDCELRAVILLREEEQRAKPVELLAKSKKLSEEIYEVRHRVRQLGLHDGPARR
jgi:hypothetical protein